VIVAAAVAGGVTVDGLTWQTGGSVKVVGVTVQLRFTAPLKLLAPTVMFEAVVPPGTTATGDKSAACSVNLWAEADEDNDNKVRKAAIDHKAAMPAYPLRTFKLDFNGLDFNMSRFRFK